MSHLSDEWCSLGIHNWGLYQRTDGLRFSIDAVLLAHFASLYKTKMRVLDIGTGTGIVAFLLAARDEQATILGVDIQPRLITNANRSRDANGLDPTRVSFAVQDMRTPDPAFAKQFDLVVCNPPFFLPQQGACSPDPELRLARHEFTLNLADTSRAAAYHLRHRGRFALIHRSDRLPDVMATTAAHHLQPARLRPVYARSGEASKLFLLECIHQGRQAMVLEDPLYIYDDAGNYRPTVRAWYEGEIQ